MRTAWSAYTTLGLAAAIMLTLTAQATGGMVVHLAPASAHIVGIEVGDGRQVVVHPQGVTLVAADGETMWHWEAPPATSSVALAAAGDVYGDGVPDIVVIRYQPMDETCGGIERLSGALWVLNGRTGSASRVGPQLGDICFTFPAQTYSNPTGPITYPQVQWVPASVSIHDGSITAFPTYATVGYLWRAGTISKLVFPSSSAYDVTFPGCMKAPGYSTCYVPFSHIAYLVWIPGGQFILTSYRAIIYARYHPVTDLTWTSGTTANGGRNKGFLFTFVASGIRYAELIGGCSVADEQLATRQHKLPGSWTGALANCSIHHHLEWFKFEGLRIAEHVNHYYGYIHTDGYARSRLEAPAPAVAPVGGPQTYWTVFNRFDGRNWVLETLPDPTRPNLVLQRSGWFAWGMADLAGNGRDEVLATHGAGYFLPWSFDVLERQGDRWLDLAHVRDLLPSEVLTTDRPDQDFGGQRYSIVVRNHRLLVETKSGRRFWLSLAGLSTVAQKAAGLTTEVRPRMMLGR